MAGPSFKASENIQERLPVNENAKQDSVPLPAPDQLTGYVEKLVCLETLRPANSGPQGTADRAK